MKSEEEIRAKIKMLRKQIIKEIESGNYTINRIDYYRTQIEELKWVLNEKEDYKWFKDFVKKKIETSTTSPNDDPSGNIIADKREQSSPNKS